MMPEHYVPPLCTYVRVIPQECDGGQDLASVVPQAAADHHVLADWSSPPPSLRPPATAAPPRVLLSCELRPALGFGPI